MKKHCVTKRSPGCGSQRLLRCRSHPAGRGPNSSSLFPPLAAVVAVASGLTDGSRAVSTKKEDPLSELQLREGVFFLMSQMTSSISTFTIYSICHSPQKSSAVQKVYKRPLRRFAPAPPKGDRSLYGDCQSLSLWERWQCEALTERASPSPESRPCSDKLSLCQSDAIAASALLRQRPCPLSHLR